METTTILQKSTSEAPRLIYHPEMIRLVTVMSATLTLAMAGVIGATAAPAEPMPPPPCGFTLSPPQVVQVDGASLVTATITSVVCGVAASPYQSVACVELAGQQGGSCMQGTDTAQAFYSQPYQPGATYSSRGRGCGIIVPTLPADNCQILGPITATL